MLLRTRLTGPHGVLTTANRRISLAGHASTVAHLVRHTEMRRRTRRGQGGRRRDLRDKHRFDDRSEILPIALTFQQVDVHRIALIELDVRQLPSHARLLTIHLPLRIETIARGLQHQRAEKNGKQTDVIRSSVHVSRVDVLSMTFLSESSSVRRGIYSGVIPLRVRNLSLFDGANDDNVWVQLIADARHVQANTIYSKCSESQGSDRRMRESVHTDR